MREGLISKGNRVRATAKICVVGSANVDLTFQIPRLPSPGETLRGRSLSVGMGGKGANQAVAAARLGAQVSFIACVGNDEYGKEAVRSYRSEGIDTSNIRQVDDYPTGTAAILLDDVAENSIVVVGGANEALAPDHIRAATSSIQAADIVLCQLETPALAALEAFRLARESDTKTVLTPAPADQVTGDLLSVCDVCVPNETELALLSGHPVNSADDRLRAARELQNQGVGQVVITLGGQGALIVGKAEPQHIAPSQVDAIDSTGAGDAFTAALAVFLAEGADFQIAAQKASIVAGISVSRYGTQMSFPFRDELDGLGHSPL